MTVGLRHVQAAAIIRAQIADGTLKPGQAAPSGAQLARLTGFCALTCRRALRDLVADGTLVPGASPNARPGSPPPFRRGPVTPPAPCPVRWPRCAVRPG